MFVDTSILPNAESKCKGFQFADNLILQ